MCPTYGSDTVLNTSAVRGPLASVERSEVPLGPWTVTGDRSSGDGNTSATNFVSRSTPTGFAAAVTSTGATFASTNPAWRPFTSSSVGSSPVSRYCSNRASSASAMASVSFSLSGSAAACSSSGHSPSVPWASDP
jgi:hypothetical protein